MLLVLNMLKLLVLNMLKQQFYNRKYKIFLKFYCKINSINNGEFFQYLKN